MIDRDNGSVVGKTNTPTSSVASGVWSMNRVARAELDSIWPGGDPYFSQVALLLHCDGSDASTTFTDHSSNGHTVSANGNAQVDTAQSKFGGASALFDGTGDLLQIANHSSLQMGSGDFTIEFWFRGSSIGTYDTLFQKGYYSTGTITLFLDATNITLDIETSRNAAAHGMSANTWYHIAAVRSGTSAKVYVDGVQKVSFTNSSNINSTAVLKIGDGDAGAMAGWIDDFRMTKGVARYTATFTPPVAPFPNS